MSESSPWLYSEEGSDPLARGTAGLPPRIGEGCLSRFDPDSLTDESGADFSAASGLRSACGEPSD